MSNNNDTLNPWQRIKTRIRTRIDSRSFETWFSPTHYIGQEREVLYIKVPNAYFKDWLSFHYGSLIAIRRSPHERKTKQGPILSPNLNPNYTFGNFVVGSCNQFAHAAALAVAQNPGRSYNPLYIYGGAGLGKTHLMNAIGHYTINDLINHLQYGKILDFRKKYRNVDILLIDDVHYLSGKERTKEEFFHTFNHLYEAQKQIVITSDCPPKEIPNLEERFSSRFEWGLIADLKPPDLETRVAIIKKKSNLEGVILPESVALYIADKVQSYSSLKGQDIDLELAEEALKGLIDSGSNVFSIEKIQKAVAQHYKIKISQLKSKNNSPKIAFPRQVGMYLAKKLTNASLPEIGRKFGGKHHTTVLHSLRKIERLLEESPDFHRELNNLINHIR